MCEAWETFWICFPFPFSLATPAGKIQCDSLKPRRFPASASLQLHASCSQQTRSGPAPPPSGGCCQPNRCDRRGKFWSLDRDLRRLIQNCRTRESHSARTLISRLVVGRAVGLMSITQIRCALQQYRSGTIGGTILNARQIMAGAQMPLKNWKPVQKRPVTAGEMRWDAGCWMMTVSYARLRCSHIFSWFRTECHWERSKGSRTAIGHWPFPFLPLFYRSLHGDKG